MVVRRHGTARSLKRVSLRSAACTALLVLVLIAVLSGCGTKSGGGSAAGAATATPEATAAPSPSEGASQSAGWLMVTLVDRSPVFGKRSTSSSAQFLILEQAFFIAGNNKSNVNLLRPFGQEVHRPEQMLLIPLSSVLYQEPLKADAPSVKAIEAYETSTPPKPSAVLDLKGGAMAAVFLRSGEVFFGNLTAEVDSVDLANAHFLRFKNKAAANARSIKSLDEVQLIPQAQAAGGSTGEMIIPTSSVLYFQILAADSPVIAALKAK